MARRRWGGSWRLAGRPDHPPLLCSGRRDNGVRLTALDELAVELGLREGQGLAEARAIHPAIDVAEEDPAADRALLEAIADWCDRYTPLVALDGSDGLFLDITGCAHLFGGEQVLLDDILLRLFQMGFKVQGAISGSPGLSWAASRFGAGGVIADSAAQEVLEALSVACLRIEADTIAALNKLGLKRVGDLISMPRAPLARRFGSQVLLRLDQALGHEEEPISPRRPVAFLSVERKLAEAIQAEEDILELASRIAQSLCSSLEARGAGGRVFELVLFRVDGRVFRIVAGASRPLRNPQRIARLFAERLKSVHDELDAGFGFELLRLNVLQHDSYEASQDNLLGKASGEAPLADLIDRVSARLGDDVLQAFQFRESHIPERAVFAYPALGHDAGNEGRQNPAVTTGRERPLRLLSRPEPVEAFAAIVPDGPPSRFRWRRVLHDVARAEGPERISPEWWLDQEAGQERDYFKLEVASGHRFWVYRQGHYSSDYRPTWHMHGIFA
ncbi:DNA polymerase Y family protein [Pseudorhizobium halotolerans]|uniref:DNA polymerase Y family protein n=1 Tax=Pseudorhizobium halotolerans TaxID=1233081 RepID=A0ABM8PDZ9_9HYPH|nr:DNA polymerase Y family protein [Pseudorhizobium halotolerans]CAD7023983.1 DNA polymerase Y family protein [Pseudorhizobium halotolerans]